MNASKIEDNIYAQLGLSRKNEITKDSSELAQEDFLKLMVTQLKNQDPFKPMESGDFLAQIAQFSTVEGINTLNESFSALSGSLSSSQALQAGQMVDREVLAPLNYGLLASGETLKGAVDLPVGTGDLVIRVSDSAGALVRELHLGTQQPGLAEFSWDGMTDRGAYAPPGVYRLDAQADFGDEVSAMSTLVSAKVDSVTLGSGGKGLTLNLKGLGPISFNDVTRIH